MTRNRKGDHLDGFFLLNKTAGISSNRALQQCKSLLNVAKAGHTGSLDPLAEGLLVICIGKMTKVSSLFLEGKKQYDVVIKLGIETDTGDGEGKITYQGQVPQLDDSTLKKALNHMLGEKPQTPPMYSALKHQGRPLYKYARQGIELERTPRNVSLYDYTINQIKNDELNLSIRCSKGFYVRSLAVDLGKKIGCGAHVKSLRRTQVCNLNINQSFSIDYLASLSLTKRRECMLPIETTLSSFKKYVLNEKEYNQLKKQQTVSVNPVSNDFEHCLLYIENGLFLGFGIIRDRTIMSLKYSQL